jgi:hypothetical protein
MAAEYIPFGGWNKNLRLFNDSVELIITLEVGPRIISFRPINGKNVFKVVAEQSGKSDESDWKIRGGHRLWTAPEDFDRTLDGRSLTYVLDNSAVEHRIEGEYRVRVSHTMDYPEKIYREMVVTIEPSGPKVDVEHHITNRGDAPLEFAPWALSVMAEDGYAIVPRPPLGRHPKDFLPNQAIVVWPFTDLSDERLRLGRRVTKLSQSARPPLKFGLRHTEKWVAYMLRDELFLKTIPLIEGAVYPDMGSNFETFTNHEIFELESLGPMKKVAPDETVTHVESWAVFSGVSLPDIQDEEDLLRAVETYVQKLL